MDVLPIFVALLGLGAAEAPAFELTSFVARFRGAVVHLSVENEAGNEIASGSGFFIAASGRIVTNHHVIENAQRMTALLSDGQRVKVTGKYADDDVADLAVLQVEGSGYPTLTLDQHTELVQGQPVVVISSPLGYEGTPSEGIVAKVRPEGARRQGHDSPEYTASWQIQHSADVSPGSSGAPLMLRDGSVVGIVVGKNIAGERLNFAVPVAKLHAVLGTIGPDAKPTPLGVPVSRNLLISGIGFATVALLWIYFGRAGRRSRREAGRAVS